jgi:hypothetical protein
MPAPASDTAGTCAGQASLEHLAAEITARGYQAHLHTPAGRLPYLDLRHPRLSILSEKVYAQAGWYWYSWAERIAACDDVVGAAATLARVLRTADGG